MSAAAHDLQQKYARLLALRHAIGHGGKPDAAALAELRAVAARWPGALRELDTLDDAELDRRHQLCATGDADWIGWMARYHQLMRGALLIRRQAVAARTGRVELAPTAAELAAASVDTLDAELVRQVAEPRHGRLNAVVFARLAVEFGRPAAELWDALFPAAEPRDAVTANDHLVIHLLRAFAAFQERGHAGAARTSGGASPSRRPS